MRGSLPSSCRVFSRNSRVEILQGFWKDLEADTEKPQYSTCGTTFLSSLCSCFCFVSLHTGFLCHSVRPSEQYHWQFQSLLVGESSFSFCSMSNFLQSSSDWLGVLLDQSTTRPPALCAPGPQWGAAARECPCELGIHSKKCPIPYILLFCLVIWYSWSISSVFRPLHYFICFSQNYLYFSPFTACKVSVFKKYSFIDHY